MQDDIYVDPPTFSLALQCPPPHFFNSRIATGGSPGPMRQNAYSHNLKWTFEDLLPCYFYAIKNKPDFKTNIGQALRHKSSTLILKQTLGHFNKLDLTDTFE